jgi:hypothetical protein
MKPFKYYQQIISVYIAWTIDDCRTLTTCVYLAHLEGDVDWCYGPENGVNKQILLFGAHTHRRTLPFNQQWYICQRYLLA